MKSLFLVLMLVGSVCASWSQVVYDHQSSDVPEGVRYQIVQSEIQSRLTFKIDKYAGMVYQLVQGKTEVTWQLMIVGLHLNDEVNKDLSKVNYQIFTSGIAVKHTYLLNVNTGATWQLAEDKGLKVDFWHPLE